MRQRRIVNRTVGRPTKQSKEARHTFVCELSTNSYAFFICRVNRTVLVLETTRFRGYAFVSVTDDMYFRRSLNRDVQIEFTVVTNKVQLFEKNKRNRAA